MKLAIYQVDAFAAKVFSGNPAAVCLLEHTLPEETMKAIASEMAVSETAFLDTRDFTLRWFTPEVEVALCGHGTLATACVLNVTGLLSKGDSVTFKTKSGKISASINNERIELRFPMPELLPCEPPQDLLHALGLNSTIVQSAYMYGEKHLFIVDNETTVAQLTPNFLELIKLKGRGITVAALSERMDVDIVSRYFAPWVGVNEDPVTGTSHCALARYMIERKPEQRSFVGYQASKRSGEVFVTVLNNDEVMLGGQAVISLKGQLRI